MSRRSGLSEPTLRYYEEVGLVGPIARDPSAAGTAATATQDLDTLQALACLRAMGVGIEDMRTYQANRALGHAGGGRAARPAAAPRRADRGRDRDAAQVHLDYLRAKAALWDARDRGDAAAEAEAKQQVQDMLPRLEETVTSDEPRCLVTGGSGYLGTQLIAALLRDGRPVRATVRSPDREAELRAGGAPRRRRRQPAWRSLSPT